MNFNFQSYDPMRMESELQEAKLREKDTQRDHRDHTKRIIDRVIQLDIFFFRFFCIHHDSPCSGIAINFSGKFRTAQKQI